MRFINSPVGLLLAAVPFSPEPKNERQTFNVYGLTEGKNHTAAVRFMAAAILLNQRKDRSFRQWCESA